MTGLVLKLSPKERVLINGAVIENGDKRIKFSIMTPDVKILRLRDAILPEDANTPVKRSCFLAQLILTGDISPQKVKNQLISLIEQLSQTLTDPDSRNQLSIATQAIRTEQHYVLLKALRALLPREDRLLNTDRRP